MTAERSWRSAARAGVLGFALTGSLTWAGVAVPALARDAASSSALTSAVPAASAEAKLQASRAALSVRVIGYSVNGHPIKAYELGDRNADVTAVALAAMHGNETAGSVVLTTLRKGNPVHDVHLWVIPRDNPDGTLRDDRHNGHGVDLNRNFPENWKRETGYYNSGPRPASEPETRILMRFLDRVDPDFVVTMHQPLDGVDVYGAKDRPFARRLSDELKLPTREFNCSGTCHGTLTQWFNARHAGACVTVEFPSSPGDRYLHVRAPRGLVRALGGYRGP
ncbi:MAG: M14 family zinc carboxypeptidase [Nocardioidaceae bacterium]